jgi:DNA processing protein
MDELDDLLRISAAEGVGALLFRRLMARFGSPKDILSASPRALEEVEGVGPKTAAALHAARNLDVGPIHQHADALGVRIICSSSPDFPVPLKSIYDPPIVLYVKGTLLPMDMLAIAVVGSRRCSIYGQTQAERLSGGLARSGFTIVSGLARGIDIAAHRGALRAKGRTIAVLACGLARIYPPEHKEMAARIAENGALISELPLAAAPQREAFPARNRLVSGLSLGVLVVEAARNSGSLITARHAAEQGREVFAVPGQVDSPLTRGAHALIKDGAKLVENVEDIIQELGPLSQTVVAENGEPYDDPRLLSMNEKEAKVYSLLSSAPTAVDDIIAALGLPVSEVNSTLTVLEIRRFVKQLTGKRFVRA